MQFFRTTNSSKSANGPHRGEDDENQYERPPVDRSCKVRGEGFSVNASMSGTCQRIIGIHTFNVLREALYYIINIIFIDIRLL